MKNRHARARDIRRLIACDLPYSRFYYLIGTKRMFDVLPAHTNWAIKHAIRWARDQIRGRVGQGVKIACYYMDTHTQQKNASRPFSYNSIYLTLYVEDMCEIIDYQLSMYTLSVSLSTASKECQWNGRFFVCGILAS